MVEPSRRRRAAGAQALLVLAAVAAVVAGQALVAVPSEDAAAVTVDGQTIEYDTTTATTTSELFTKDGGVFVPTDDWQEVPKNQHLPRGLEIRMDLEHGKTYARKVAKSPKATTSATATEAAAEASPQPADGTVTPEEAAFAESLNQEDALKWSILQGLPEPEPEIEEALRRRVSNEELRDTFQKVWTRRQQQLKEYMDKLQTQGQVLQTLVGQIRNSTSTEDLVDLLQELEDHITFLINAEDFVTTGGLDLAFKLMKHDSEAVRTAAAWVFGTAVKYNPVAQRIVRETGLLLPFIEHMDLAVTNHASPAELTKILYALAGILRAAEDLQAQFNLIGGPQLIRRLLHEHMADRLAAKTVQLLADLADEVVPADPASTQDRQAEDHRPEDAPETATQIEPQGPHVTHIEHGQKVAVTPQANATVSPLQHLLKSHDVCHQISLLLRRVDDLQLQQSVVKSMFSLRRFCTHDWQADGSLLLHLDILVGAWLSRVEPDVTATLVQLGHAVRPAPVHPGSQ